MSTNYYLQEKVCGHCGNAGAVLHIGKSSAGWCFALHSIPEEDLKFLKDWEERWARKGNTIHDEYSRLISPSEMFAIITDRSWPIRENFTGDVGYPGRNAEWGPRGLLRAKLGGNCVAHGSGTWDMIKGEFS